METLLFHRSNRSLKTYEDGGYSAGGSNNTMLHSSCATPHCNKFYNIFSISKETLVTIKQSLPISHYHCAFCPCGYLFWIFLKNVICGLLCLASFTQHNVFKMSHVAACYFFFSKRNYFISFYGWIIFHCKDIPHRLLYFHQLMNIWMFLVTVNNAAMNIRVQVNEWTYIFISLGYMLS